MRIRILLFVALQALLVPIALGQQYPSKPVRLIVPFAPGGFADIAARILGERLTNSLGQTFLVENRPGAGGTLGTAVLARAEPDGYSLILQDMAYTISPAVYRELPYRPLEDFTPITLVAHTYLWLFVSPSLPARSVTDFIALAKAQPGKYTVSSSGNGGGSHLMIELLMRGAGIKLVHVPYKGGGPAVNAAVSGEVAASFSFMPIAKSLVQGHRLRAIGVTAAARDAAYPDVPTFEESGIPNMIVRQWIGLMGPAGLPAEIVRTLNQNVKTVMSDPVVIDRFKALTLIPETSSPQEFRALVDSDLKRWSKVVKEANIAVQ